MSYQKNLRVLTVAVVVLTAVSLIVGCSSKSTLDTTTPTSGDQVSIQIQATPSSLETNQTSVIVATVTNGGTGVADQVIQFTVTPVGAGTVTPAVDTTGVDGVAATIFTATLAGAASLEARILGTSTADATTIAVTQAAGGGTGNITIASSEALLQASGQDSALITIVVRDELGQVAADGTLIKIAAGEKFIDVDGNGYYSQNIDSLVFDANGNGQWDAFGLIPSTALIAGGAGQIIVDYVSGDEAHTVYIKVTVDDGGIQGYAELTIQLTPNTVLHSIYLASDSISLSVAQTGGIETSTLRATGFDIHGNQVPEGMAIEFLIVDGPNGGEALETGVGTVDTAYTNGQGIATSTISSGTISGTVRVRAKAGTVLSNATQILIAAGPPQYIVVAAEERNVPFWSIVGEELDITAVVSDIYLNPVNDSTVVYFWTDEGTMMSNLSRTMEGKGIATSIWISGTNVVTADGIVMVNAETAGGTVSSSSAFYNTDNAINLSISNWRDSLTADGEDKFAATIQGLDLNGNPVVSGTQFKAMATYLKVSGGTFEDGYNSATDRVEVLSTTLTRDRSATGGNDDGIGAIDFVTYWVEGGGSVTDSCFLWTGPANGKSSTIDSPTSAQPGEVINLLVTVADRWGNPLADHTLNMTAADGVVGGASQESDQFGEAFGFTWTAPALDGDYNVVVTDTDPRGSGMVLTQKITVKAATK